LPGWVSQSPAAYDAHRARVLGRCEPTTGIAPFSRLVDQVMTSEPYASARRVFWIVDNGASHRNWAAAARLNNAYSNAHMVHSPVHASWLNQVEIYFSAVQRKALTPDDFLDLDEGEQRLLTFQNRYNTTATPSTGDSPATTSTSYSPDQSLRAPCTPATDSMINPPTN
jgi:hypothetical protein